MAREANVDALGKPVEAVTQPPVRRGVSGAASAEALGNLGNLAANLGIQFDQANEARKLRTEIDQVKDGYAKLRDAQASGAEIDMTDPSIIRFVGDIDNIREAIAQGAINESVGLARMELALKGAKARRPGYEDFLNKTAAGALGIDINGWATKKLFDTPKASGESMEDKLYKREVEYLLDSGMDYNDISRLSREQTFSLAARGRAADSDTENMLTQYRLLSEEESRNEVLMQRAATGWYSAQLTKLGDMYGARARGTFMSLPVGSPERQEAEVAWREAGISGLRDMSDDLEGSFVAWYTTAFGQEAAARLSPSAVRNAVQPTREAINLRIEQLKDPVRATLLANHLELEMSEGFSKFLNNAPNARRFYEMMPKEARGEAALTMSVSGIVSKQRIGDVLGAEATNYFFPSDNASRQEKREGSMWQGLVQRLSASISKNEVGQTLDEFYNTIGAEGFSKDLSSDRAKAEATGDAILGAAASTFGAIQDGQIDKSFHTQAIANIGNMADVMVERAGNTLEVPRTAQLLNLMSSPAFRSAEQANGVDLTSQRLALQERLMEANDRMSTDFIQSSLGLSGQTVGSRSYGNTVNIPDNPLDLVSFQFDVNTGKATGFVPNLQEYGRSPRMRVSAFSPAGNAAIREAVQAPARAFNNMGNGGYSRSVGAVFASEYNALRSEKGKVDLADNDTALRLAQTGVLKSTGVLTENPYNELATLVELHQSGQDVSRYIESRGGATTYARAVWPTLVEKGLVDGVPTQVAEDVTNSILTGTLREAVRVGRIRIKE